ncbi:hypothetical protein [Moorella sulfitireducens (nom. illeg.)]|uniref:hypothetical protein n=1 Tax=Neomoorella sulfitireducens TaxID=2972948 RepID=UPI0021ABFDD9|nr:hypothetical protein [Moorella sulfitireducens]
MGYQAPIILLATVVLLVLVYSLFWWRQKELTFTYSTLALLVGNQENFLEGILRRFWWWCFWYGVPWKLVIIIDVRARASVAILHQFFYPYPSFPVIFSHEEVMEVGRFPAGDDGRQVYLLDIRREKDFSFTWEKICRVLKK